MPTPQQIRRALEKVLREVQRLSGRPCPPITDTTNPFDDLEEFDSLTAVEATVLLEIELGCTLADGGVAFISETARRKRALTVGEAVGHVSEMIVPARVA